MVTTRRRWLVAIAMLLGGLAVGSGLTWVILTRSFSFGGNAEAVADRPPESFTISGDLAEPAYPGGSAPLNLSISNPLDVDLAVSQFLVEIDAVDAPNATDLLPCDVHDFSVEQLSWHDELIVGAGTTVSLADLDVLTEHWPRVLMLDTASNQDGCKGASVSLAYSAAGRIVE
ncbi:hypothetical protein [Pseudolysinimonas sp.]|uniref:hypothetical protein n=1 Tax=Pseudolysinimonas sp. TaxID=2680009 RepID=UPI00286C5D8D|nr:hypothetical protein [Pseudolysinimonas sp.]